MFRKNLPSFIISSTVLAIVLVISIHHFTDSIEVHQSPAINDSCFSVVKKDTIDSITLRKVDRIKSLVIEEAERSHDLYLERRKIQDSLIETKKKLADEIQKALAEKEKLERKYLQQIQQLNNERQVYATDSVSLD